MAASIWRREFYATRASAHVAFAVIVWPLVTITGTTAAILLLPYYSVSFSEALLAAVGAVVVIAPDMLLVGSIIFSLSAFIFQRLGPEPREKRLGYARLGLEPAVTCLALMAGASLWYPAILSAPLLALVRHVPAAGVIALLFFSAAVAAAFAARPGKRAPLVAVTLAVAMLVPVPLSARVQIARWAGHAPTAIVLGIDSVSHADEVQPLEHWTRANSGAWYEYAVAPGLLTNAVWSSILTMQPVRSHGVFLTFQRLAADDAALLAAARGKGYRTISAFSDQLTCMVGSRAGFDEDRSGPVGWRQLLLPIAANNSFLVPLVRPALPRLPFTALVPNQAGTITYDVRREVRELLRTGSGGQPTLVMAHLTYPHLPAYPGSLELTWTEFSRVVRAPAGTIADRSFDWQDTDRAADPLQLHRWKIAHVQQVIASEVDASQYLEKGGRLIVFSDHGDRAHLTVKKFGEPRYHHVLLATFGLPSRCTRAPISLADIGSLLQLSNVVTEPAVEYMFTPETLVPILFRHARIRWSGDVDIDQELLSRLFKELLRHDPWPDVSRSACQQTNRVR